MMSQGVFAKDQPPPRAPSHRVRWLQGHGKDAANDSCIALRGFALRERVLLGLVRPARAYDVVATNVERERMSAGPRPISWPE